MRDTLNNFNLSYAIIIETRHQQKIKTAIAQHREIMGATNPKEAAEGTIRADFASSIDENAVHGSDSAESAAREISYFFNDDEVCARKR